MAEKQPNVVIIMTDQFAGPAFPGQGSPVKAPALEQLASEGVVFDNAYATSPLCSPSRASFMSGLLSARTQAYDNAAEFASSVPTFVHYLRSLGYRTCLSGKMHFVGPDQLHGFEERLTTDIYPADFGWTPDWTKPQERIDWWYHNLLSVKQAGIAESANQLDYDDVVAHEAVRRIYNFAKNPEDRPFCLAISFTHPHDPYAARKKHWDLYREDEITPPAVPAIPYEEMDPHSQRLFRVSAIDNWAITDEDIVKSRRAYYANISYIDEHVAVFRDTLQRCGLEENTAILFLSDHGDFMGERGLWYKMSFFEWSARVPLILHMPERFSPRRVTEPAGITDILPTLVDLAVEPDGASLVPLAEGAAEPERTVYGDYAGEGAIAPVVMIRRGNWKFVHSPADPDQLFDLTADPNELKNLAQGPAHADFVAGLRAEVAQKWNLEAFTADVLSSQRARRAVYNALKRGHYFPWGTTSPCAMPRGNTCAIIST